MFLTRFIAEFCQRAMFFRNFISSIEINHGILKIQIFFNTFIGILKTHSYKCQIISHGSIHFNRVAIKGYNVFDYRLLAFRFF